MKKNISLVEAEIYFNHQSRMMKRVCVRINGDFWKEAVKKNHNTPDIDNWVSDTFAYGETLEDKIYGLWEDRIYVNVMPSPELVGDSVFINYLYHK